MKSGHGEKWSCRGLLAFTHTFLTTSLDQEEEEEVMNKTMHFGNVNKVFYRLLSKHTSSTTLLLC